jgi:hypothetical protein
MDRISTRTLSLLKYEDPLLFLLAARPQTEAFAAGELNPDLRSLRKAEGKPGRERREAAMFCHLLSQRLGKAVSMAVDEAQDFDCVASWAVGQEVRFVPIQLKELPPFEANDRVALEEILAGLSKYTDSRNTIFAVHLNRRITIDPMQIAIPNLKIDSLWLFAAVTPNLLQWCLWGDLLMNPFASKHAYPDA